MKKPIRQTIAPDLLLDCSQEDQVNFWAEIFQVTPEAVKTAVRACCDNRIACISAYLKNTYNTARDHLHTSILAKTNF